MAQIFRLVDTDVFIEGISMDCNYNKIEEIIVTHNAFKAKHFEDLSDTFKTEIADKVRKDLTTLVEVVEILQ